ncbi:MAG: TRAP transporter large permease [Dehalococcoidales bacterium]|nr:TRAP transporter large permease [Dehalococcoidales bacterium]
MTPMQIGFIGLAVMLLLLFIGIPVGFSLTLVAFAGFAILVNFDAALGLLRTIPYSTVSDYGLTVLPLFLLMGAFTFKAGLTKDLYHAAHAWLGKLPGGLSVATIGACAAFAAVSGSSVATAVTMGTVALPEMKRYNYSPSLSTGSVAAGGTIGILIPPSVGLILYGIITETSIGQLFLAGFIPGILQAVFYIITILILCKINPNIAPPAPGTTFMYKLVSLKNTWIVLCLFLLVIGGIYLGVFSPTEAAGIGAFGAFVFALARRRLGWAALKDSLLDTMKSTGMVFTMMIGAILLTYFMAVTRLPYNISEILTSFNLNNYILLAGILIFYIILGCFLDTVAMIMLTVPIFFPVITAMGFSPIWFGIIVVRIAEIGLITPPVGMNVYVIKGMAPDVPMGTIFKGIVPFVAADVVHVALLVALPSISLLLPSFM